MITIVYFISEIIDCFEGDIKNKDNIFALTHFEDIIFIS